MGSGTCISLDTTNDDGPQSVRVKANREKGAKEGRKEGPTGVKGKSDDETRDACGRASEKIERWVNFVLCCEDVDDISA